MGEIEPQRQWELHTQFLKHKEVLCDQGIGRRPVCSWSPVGKGSSRSSCTNAKDFELHHEKKENLLNSRNLTTWVCF